MVVRVGGGGGEGGGSGGGGYGPYSTSGHLGSLRPAGWWN